MRPLIAIVAALICASCGGGSASVSSADPPAAAPASAGATPSMAAPPATSAQSSTPAAGPIYRVVEIPRLTPTGSVTANGVNDQGVVVGQQETSTAPRAWMYQQSSGALDELSLDPSQNGAYANGISDSGVIAGAEIPSNGAPVPGFWTVTGGSMPLTGQYQSFAQAVAANDDGTIIGDYGAPGTVSSLPLVWTAPGYAESTLPGLRCDQCTRLDVTASAVNDSGLIVGSSNYGNAAGGTSGMHAVEWQAGAIIDLGGLQSADYSAAYAISTSGDVVGASRTSQASGAPTHAFLYHQGIMTDLGTLPGDSGSSADSINVSGQIVGTSQSDTAKRAFLYQNGQMYDLNSLIDPASQLTGLVSLQEAVGISANGWIAVNGTDSRDPGWTRAFLLIPAQ